MSISAALPAPPSLPPLCRPAKPSLRTQIRIRASSSLAPKPLVRRRNHLRRKLLRSPPPPPPPPTSDEAPAAHILLPQEPLPPPAGVEVTEALLLENQVLEPAQPHGQHRWFPGPVLDLGFKFAALIVVQTAVAVWVLGGGGANPEERRDGGDVEREKEVVGEREVGEDVREFEKKVMEIRVTAREARMIEEKDAGGDSGVEEEVGRRLDWLRKRYAMVNVIEDGSASPYMKKVGGKRNGEVSNTRKRLGVSRSSVKARDAPKGFNMLKDYVERDGGGIQQITRWISLKQSVKLQEPGHLIPCGSESTEKSAGVEDSADSTCEDGPAVVDLHISSEQLVDNEGALTSKNKNVNGVPKDIKSGLSSDGISSIFIKSYKQPNISKDVSPRGINGRLESSSQTREVEHQSVVKKDEGSQHDITNKSWWRKLPYVLAIHLRRGFDRNGPSGLYSLKKHSPSQDGIFLSYTIAFQDQGDATNFCYLLESFFEDLGDVSADIVPLTIQELDEALGSGEEVLAIKKGQLKLYAGQPLVEVETSLHSLIK